MSLLRALVALVVVAVAVVLQVSFFPPLSWHGVVPNVALLVVVAAALVRGPQFASLLGFAAGLAVDLAPPADHIAGRWALAFVVVGYLAGRIRTEMAQESRPGPAAVVAAVAASSFIATSVYAFSGLVLSDPVLEVSAMMTTILVALVFDLLLTPLVMPPVMKLFDSIRPARVAL
jgi:rod shape-determining protein MreD